jgi:hypothetical protein
MTADFDDDVYGASPLKRATRAEMEERARFLIDYAEKHGPVTVRGLYYQAEVADRLKYLWVESGGAGHLLRRVSG